MDKTALKLVEPIEVEEKALTVIETANKEVKKLTIVDQAGTVKVIDSESYLTAGKLWKDIGDMIKEVKDTFDPICDAAHKAHKSATEKRSKYLDPLTSAQKSVKALMSAYDADQERIRKAEEARLAEIARKEEEERRLKEAIEIENEAIRNGATKEEAAQEAATIIEQPVYVAPVVVQKTTPKMTGGPVYREVWAAEIVDIKALCLAVATGKASTEFVTGNMVALNRQAVSLKGTMNIPGVKSYSKRV
jgi:hypothetical protein